MVYSRETRLRGATVNDDIDCSFTFENDDKGFAVNCDIMFGEFDTTLVPALLIHFTRDLCKQLGVDFNSAMRTALGAKTKNLGRVLPTDSSLN